jgi:predicted nucleotidyltransferase component of viral defense system
MDVSEIRRIVIVAMFSDDILFEKLALKGGNAVNLVYKFGSRTSIDIDLSIDSDFSDIDDTKNRIFQSLQNRFAEVRYTVFDERFESRPPVETGSGDGRWGGYEASFKLIETAKYEILAGDGQRAQREAVVVGTQNERIFRIQISKYEYCLGKREVEFDNYTIRVYTPEMLALEKIRAICQQMPEYGKRAYPTPRARDFYDIYTIVTKTQMELYSPANLALIKDIFQAKDVDEKLIAKIGNYREFHRPDWPSVRLSVVGEIEEFDFYFNFVLDHTRLFESLWNK